MGTMASKSSQSTKKKEPSALDLKIRKIANPFIILNHLRQLSPHDTSEYYKHARFPALVWFDGLDDIQRQCLLNHAADVRSAGRRRARNPILAYILQSPVYALTRFALGIWFNVVKTFANQPLLPFTDPVNVGYALLGAFIVFTALFVFQLALTVGYYLRLSKPLLMLREALYDLSNEDMFKRGFFIFEHGESVELLLDGSGAHPRLSSALPVLSTPLSRMKPPKLEPLKHPHKTHKEPTILNLDVARAMLLCCTLVYERSNQFIKMAMDYPAGACKYLMRSEANMFFWARVYGMRFTSVTDFATGTGAFAGIFYKIEDLKADEAPFAILTFKGTGPLSLTEWMVDAGFSLEDCGDWLANGSAHKGFLNNLFPMPTDQMRVIPWVQITDAIKLIANESAKKNLRKKLQLHVTGHSLGAGMATLCTARLLETPGDVGPHVQYRDSYLFGTPRSLSGVAASRFENNLLRPENRETTVWRICNRSASRYIGDIVCRVPPGLCDLRKNRTTVKSGSLLSYGHIGVGVSLTPKGLSPFWTSIAQNGPIRIFQTGAIDYGFKRAKEEATINLIKNPLQLASAVFVKALPWAADHGPKSYLDSLDAVEVSKIDTDLVDPSALEGIENDLKKGVDPASTEQQQTNVGP